MRLRMKLPAKERTLISFRPHMPLHFMGNVIFWWTATTQNGHELSIYGERQELEVHWNGEKIYQGTWRRGLLNQGNLLRYLGLTLQVEKQEEKSA